MTDRHRFPTSGRRSPPNYNPARMSMPTMPTTNSAYSSFYGSDIHVVPTSRHEAATPSHYNHHRNNTSDWRGPNVPVTTTTYTVRKDPVTRAASVREDSRNRTSSLDAATKRPPIIVTTRQSKEPSSSHTPTSHLPASPAPDRGREAAKPSDEDPYYTQPASSIRSRSHARPYHPSGSISSTLDNDEFLRLRQRTNDERLLPSRTEHRRERPTSMYADPARLSTKTLDLGDSGYEYTTPSALARYDLDNDKPHARRNRRDSIDRNAYYRPSVNVSTDVGRPYDGRPRAPPPSRALDTYNRRLTTDDATATVYDRPTVRVPAPAAVPIPVPERRAGQLDVPPSPMDRIERRSSRAGPRPVSLYQEPPRPLHNDVYRARDDGYVPRDHRDRDYLRDEDVNNRGFGVRVDGDRKDDRGKVREREDVAPPRERRTEQRRDARPDDRERELRRRPDEELDRRDDRKYSRDQGRKDDDPRLDKKGTKDDIIRDDDRGKDKVRDKVATGLSLAAGAIGLGEALTHKGKEEKAEKERSPRRHSDEDVREGETEERYKPTRKDPEERIGLRDDFDERPRRDRDLDDAEERDRNRRDAEARLNGEPAMSGALDDHSSSDENKPRRRRRPSSAFRPNDTAGLLALKEQLKAKEESDKGSEKDRSKDSSPDRRSQPSPSNRDSLEDPARSNKDDARGRDAATAHDDKQVRVVSPPRDKEDKKPIKGILKQPKPAFPEEPNPVREGVAPHKDDKTKGNVPPGARWTKISRKLVNPEALTIGKERFEVREDFVIVLRVLNKEEIEAYTAATAQLREMRRKEYEREQERDRDDERDDDDSDDKRTHRSHRRDPRDEDEDERRRREEKREKEGRSRRHRYEEEDEPRRLEYYGDDARERLPHRSHRHREREREPVSVRDE
ncbi:hypothetical protein VP1G_07125 [Cytospora mali]|uniref:DUF8035 domain-containing protein n=1 Tax=Cytospora mali TaxID=578113 RepID=A0A194V7L9_CYTMA|nr:hypothetical protein VP1G_07125 [Valsa mali var. pyri (nom. inval.)]